ncbi:MAG: Spermidine N(1)-acetyltransferase [Promethearchaeota archaeon]|nr:MAG: Spermidine N(1)-acetyltransferase [Candidatus Lokiarchaeota archaeon]
MNEEEEGKKSKEEKEDIIAPFLEGESVDLLPLNLDHLNLYTKWFNLEEMRLFSGSEFPQTKEEIKKKFESEDKGTKQNIFLEIWRKKEKKAIGLAIFNHINWFNRSANMLVIVEPDYQKEGIGTEVGKILVEYGFLELNLQKLQATISDANTAGWKLAEKVGFALEAKLEDETYLKGKYYDERKYGLLRENWSTN